MQHRDADTRTRPTVVKEDGWRFVGPLLPSPSPASRLLTPPLRQIENVDINTLHYDRGYAAKQYKTDGAGVPGQGAPPVAPQPQPPVAATA